MLKTLVKSTLQRAGLDLVRYPPLTSPLRRFLEANEIDLVLDVGAFRGQFAQFLRRKVGYSGAIVSFEPCASSFAELSATMARDPNWRGFQFGLGDTEGEAILNTYGERGDFNSVLTLKSDAAKAYQVNAKGAKGETIRICRLDAIWDQVAPGRSPRALLKIDTQGHDTAVLRGAVGIVDCLRGALAEIPAIELYEGMPSMKDSLQLFIDVGFVPIDFFPVSPIESLGICPEFDVLFKRFEGLN